VGATLGNQVSVKRQADGGLHACDRHVRSGMRELVKIAGVSKGENFLQNFFLQGRQKIRRTKSYENSM